MEKGTLPPWLIVSKEQLKEGWKEFRPEEIPNVINHPFTVIGQNPQGNWVVRNPEVEMEELRLKARATGTSG